MGKRNNHSTNLLELLEQRLLLDKEDELDAQPSRSPLINEGLRMDAGLLDSSTWLPYFPVATLVTAAVEAANEAPDAKAITSPSYIRTEHDGMWERGRRECRFNSYLQFTEHRRLHPSFFLLSHHFFLLLRVFVVEGKG